MSNRSRGHRILSLVAPPASGRHIMAELRIPKIWRQPREQNLNGADEYIPSGSIEHKNINDARRVRVISVMATSFFFSSINTGHRTSKQVSDYSNDCRRVALRAPSDGNEKATTRPANVIFSHPLECCLSNYRDAKTIYRIPCEG